MYVSSRAGPGLGGGFTPDAACVFFDGTVAVAAETRFVSSAAMACVAPALAEQPSTLVAVASGPGASTRALAGSERPFATWRSPEALEAIGASARLGGWVGSEGGGETTRMSAGAGDVFGRFAEGAGAKCRFGAVAVDAAFDRGSDGEGDGAGARDATVACVSPAGVGGRSVRVWIETSISDRPQAATLEFSRVATETRDEIPSDAWGWEYSPAARAEATGFATVSVAGRGGSAVVSYPAQPRVLAVSPKTGYARGGAIASMTGADFVADAAACAYGDVLAPAVFISSGLLRCESPALGLGVMTVEASAGAGAIQSESEMTVSVIADMRVQYVTPASGPTEGGNVVMVYGKYFVGIEPVACKLGSIGPLDARDNDAAGLNFTSSLECVAPAHEGGAARVAVGIRTAGYTDEDVHYLYESALPVQAVVPTGGESSALRVVSVFGMSLRVGSGSTCVVGPRASPGTMRRHGEMACDVQGGFGEGFFAVGAGGLQKVDGELNVIFEFRKPAEALALHPRSGYMGGGSAVQISGMHMSEGTGCAFGGMPGVAHLVSTALMRCEAPASESHGDAGMRLTDGLQTSSAAELMYEFRAEETVLDVVPSSTSTAGGELVDVSAVTLTNSRDLACAVGSIAPVSARYVSAGVGECAMPSRTEGSTEIRIGVGNEFGRIGKTMSFTAEAEAIEDDTQPVPMDMLAAVPVAEPILEDVTVREVEPSVLVATEGGIISVSGDFGVVETARCRVGSIDVTGRLMDGSTVECVAPHHVADTVMVGINGVMGGSLEYVAPDVVDIASEVEAELNFTMAIEMQEPAFDASTVRAVEPSEVVTIDGGVITITGSFGDALSVSCRVGSIGPISGRRVNANTVECMAPARGAGEAEVAVNGATGISLEYIAPNITEDVVFDDLAAEMEVYEPEFDGSIVTEIAPSFVTASEGGAITISGSFDGVESVSCRVGTVGPVAGRLIDTTTVECFAPLHVPGAVDVAVNGASGVSMEYVDSNATETAALDGASFNLTYGIEMEEPTFDSSEVQAIEPTSVAASAGGVVTVFGSFPDAEAIACRFGAVGVTGRLVDTYTAECFAPFHASGMVDVAVNGATGIHLRYNMTVDDALAVEGEAESVFTGEVLSVVPRRVSTLGSPRTVAMVGTDFVPEISRCHVGESSWPAEFVSSAMMLCEMPARGPGAVVVATEEYPANLTATALYMPEVVLKELSEPSGDTGGGTMMTISSEWLPDGDALTARFGTIGSVATRWMSRQSAEVVTPARRAGLERVWLDVFDNSFSSTSALFEYVETGAVTAVMGSLAPLSGMREVSVVGWNLRLADLTCVIGGTDTRGCVLPVGATGFATVSVAGRGGSAVVSYPAQPRVLAVSPKTGYARGGAIASMTGADFVADAAACAYGDVLAPAVFISSGLLRCESPALGLGVMTVEASAGAGAIQSESEMTVSVIADMRVQYVTPASGPTEGGNVVMVYGKYFVGIEPVACKLGSIGPLDARDNDAAGLNFTSSLECVAPAHEGGAARVAVGIRTAGYTDEDVHYLYESALPVQAVVPTGGESSALRVVSVFGMSLRVGSGSTCVVGPRASPGTMRRHGEMACDVQGGFGEGFFAVGAGGLQKVDGELNVIFEFRKPAEALALHPRSGYMGGGSAVQISGMHMSEGTGCAFGGMPGVAHLVSTALMRCEAPASESHGDAGMRLTDGLQTSSAAELMYEFRAEETVLDVVPSSTSTAGGELVDVSAVTLTNSRDLACAVGSIAPVSARYVSAGVGECAMPSRTEGSTEIRIGVGNEFGRIGKTMSFTAEAEAIEDDTQPVPMDMLAAVPVAEPILEDVTVREVEPSVLVATEGGIISVSGDFGVVETARCRVGSIDVTGRLMDGSTVECVAPHHVADTVMVGINGVMGGSLEYVAPDVVDIASEVEAELNFTMAIEMQEPAFDASTVRAVEPSEVVTIDGGVITITGSFGDALSVSCRVGSIGPISGRRVNANTVECMAPARGAGEAEVAVNGATGISLEYIAPNITEDVVFDDLAAEMEVYEPEFDGSIVTEIAPSFVTASEGGAITISGSFDGVESVSCRVGTVGPVAGRLIDTTTVECFAPLHVPGAVDVAVNGASGVSMEYVDSNATETAALDGASFNLTYGIEMEEPTFDSSEVQAIEPTSVAASAGGVVTVFGSFPDAEAIACRFGAVGVTGRLVDTYTAECFAPFHASGMVDVAVNGATGIHLRYNMTVDDALAVEGEAESVFTGEVLSVVPRRVSTLGSPRTVAMVGTDFVPEISRCHVGESSWPAEFVSSAMMLCEMPARGPGAVVVATEEYPANLTATALYMPEVVLKELSEPSGDTGGGTMMTISSEWLPDGDALTARFGTIGSVATRWMSRQSAEVVTPARRAGLERVWLDVFDNSFSSTSALFEYVETGAVTAVMGSLAPLSGMREVSVVGWNLRLADLTCVIGGTDTRGCVLPVGATGFATVSVAGRGGSAVVSYPAQPRVLAVSPKTGYARGGAIASMTGADFVADAAACAYGDVLAPAVFISSGLLRCESPALGLGVMTVEASAGAGAIQSESEMTVSVIADMRVQYVTPASGPTEGGNVVMVYGKYFVGIEPVACKLGSIGPLDARDNDAAGLNFTSSLECVAPAHEGGAARVAVGIRTAGYTDEDVHYLYESALPVQAVVPTGGESSALRVVSVFGMSLRVGSGSTCVVGPRASPGTMRRHGEMACDVQGGFGEGFFAVGAGGLEVVRGELNVIFEFRKPAEALALHPRSGYMGGGSAVQISGTHMSEGTGCAFGGMPGVAHLVSTALMRCEAPASESHGDAGMRLTDGLQTSSAAELMYEFRAEETVLDVVPSSTSTAGGELVDVSAVTLTNSRDLACAVGKHRAGVCPVRVCRRG